MYVHLKKLQRRPSHLRDLQPISVVLVVAAVSFAQENRKEKKRKIMTGTEDSNP